MPSCLLAFAILPPLLFDLLVLGFLILLFVTIVVTAIGSMLVHAPYLPTAQGVSTEMVRFADLRGDETVYDLGAGDGRLLIAAKRLHPDIRGIGVEYVPTVWLLGKFRIWWSGLTVDLRLGDALKQNLSDAGCVFLYMSPDFLEVLEQKLDKELPPGTKVVSYVFQFKRHQPVQEKSVPWLGSMRKIRLYQW